MWFKRKAVNLLIGPDGTAMSVTGHGGGAWNVLVKILSADYMSQRPTGETGGEGQQELKGMSGEDAKAAAEEALKNKGLHPEHPGTTTALLTGLATISDLVSEETLREHARGWVIMSTSTEEGYKNLAMGKDKEALLGAEETLVLYIRKDGAMKISFGAGVDPIVTVEDLQEAGSFSEAIDKVLAGTKEVGTSLHGLGGWLVGKICDVSYFGKRKRT